MRGEDATATMSGMRVSGSPPHARGRPIWPGAGRIRIGITPACAGKTKPSGAVRRYWPDHPRMRGEDWPAMFAVARRLGSPPHARGRLVRNLVYEKVGRITPACAGKTAGWRSPSAQSEDHPRMRGEDSIEFQEFEGTGGSPPHARGRRQINGEFCFFQ